jgi:hypothetical protein
MTDMNSNLTVHFSKPEFSKEFEETSFEDLAGKKEVFLKRIVSTNAYCLNHFLSHLYFIIFQFNVDRYDQQAKLAQGIGAPASWVHNTYGKGSMFVELFGTKGASGGHNVEFSASKAGKSSGRAKKGKELSPDYDDNSDDFIDPAESTKTTKPKRGKKRVAASTPDEGTKPKRGRAAAGSKCVAQASRKSSRVQVSSSSSSSDDD